MLKGFMSHLATVVHRALHKHEETIAGIVLGCLMTLVLYLTLVVI
jgi:hypothetical protein